MRLQVFISHSGHCSRRQALKIVKEGRVEVNGRVEKEPSTDVDPQNDRVWVDRKEIKLKKYTYLLFNKPKGYVTSKQEQGRQKTIFHVLPRQFHHLVPVGRLDKDTEGLLLLTNDGDASYKLTHPKFNVEKTYYARIQGVLKKQEQKSVEQGIIIDGKKTAPAKVVPVKQLKDQTALKITIHEGRKRQIRIMFAKVGHKVLYLKRLAQGPLNLGDLMPGGWRPLHRKEVEAIKNL